MVLHDGPDLMSRLPEHIRRRMGRLREELADAGIELPDGPELLREIDRARFPHRHERRFPSYGAIVSGSDDTATVNALDELGAVRLPAPRDTVRGVRQM